jgi:hypothetical protein
MNRTGKLKQILIFLTVLLVGFAGLTGYHIITGNTAIDFKIEWDMFHSILLGPLLIIGFLLGLGQKFHVYEAIIRIEHPDGSVEEKKDGDIINNLEAGCLMPILQYLILGPILIAAMIYYTIMALVYLFGVIFPYLIAGFLLFTVILFYKWESRLIAKPLNLWSMPFVMSLFTGFMWLLYISWVSDYEASVQWVNPVALAIIPVAILPFVITGIQAKKKGNPSDTAETGEDHYRPSSMSKSFLVTYIVSLLIIFGIYSFKATSALKARINIPATNEYFKPSDGNIAKHMTAVERKALGIDNITLDNINRRPGKELAVGREIWQGDAGRLTTFLVDEPDHATREYLVSRDPQGNLIDCIQTGCHLVYAGDYSYSLIAGNTIKRSSSWAEPLDAAGNGFGAIYTITGDLHFQPFTWPPDAFPCEVPFMTREVFQTDENGNEKPFPYQFDAIICTGVSGKTAGFTVKGKGLADSRKAGSADRTLLLEPVNVEWEPSGKVTTVAFPAINSGETFEVRVKATIDGSTFAKIQIRRKESS